MKASSDRRKLDSQDHGTPLAIIRLTHCTTFSARQSTSSVKCLRQLLRVYARLTEEAVHMFTGLML